ncbi:penicillin-binding protein [Flavobacteriaceae bacterium UJ101]|nr:penicillin-binding protein [Flavobacteriaceae bacterium UJ101]
MEKNNTVYIFFGVIIIFVAIFILKLAQLQLWDDKYIVSSNNLSIRKKITVPERGFIYDRTGKLLVANNPSYDINLIYGKGLGEDFDTLELCKLIKIDTAKFNVILKDAKFKYNTPYALRENVSQDEIAYIQEKIHHYPNIKIDNRISREYLVNSGYHILGYLRKISPKQLKKDTLDYYNQNDRVGKAGVEASYEKVLRGEKGVEYFRVDNRGNIIGNYENGEKNKKPIAGHDITLTIDFKLQQYAEKLMQNKRGAVVAIDPNNGEILALVSSPYINPKEMNDQNFNHYFSIYNNDTIYNRLNNKAAAGRYPPGSPFKMLVGLAALQENVIQDSISKYICKHGFPLGRGRKMGCHCGYYYRPIRVDQAIAKSCNNFFASSYRDIVRKYDNDSIGINQWRKHMQSFGLDTWFGNDIHEGSKGKIPSANTYNRYYGPYSSGKWGVIASVSNGIGQGEVEATPLQMANFTAAIANKGFYYTPHIVKAIDNKVLTDSIYHQKKITTVDPKHFDVIIKGMQGVFDYGTARRFRYNKIPMAGKTGTSQNPQGQDHSIFTLFAPVDNPKIAIATIVENGHYGATWAGPISSLVAEKYLTDTIKRTRLEKRMISKSFYSEYKKQAENYYQKVQANKRKNRIEAVLKSINQTFDLVDSLKIIQPLNTDSLYLAN